MLWDLVFFVSNSRSLQLQPCFQASELGNISRTESSFGRSLGSCTLTFETQKFDTIDKMRLVITTAWHADFPSHHLK